MAELDQVHSEIADGNNMIFQSAPKGYPSTTNGSERFDSAQYNDNQALVVPFDGEVQNKLQGNKIKDEESFEVITNEHFGANRQALRA